MRRQRGLPRDLARGHPYHLATIGTPEDLDEFDWRTLSPLLVVEFLSEDSPDKDLVRNVELYGQVPSIQEYWIFDTRQGAGRPTLLAYRRRDRRRWRKPLTLGPGSTYATDLLPGFTLTIDPRT